MRRCTLCGITTSSFVSQDHPNASRFSNADQLKGYLNNLSFRYASDESLLCHECEWEIKSSLMEFEDE